MSESHPQSDDYWRQRLTPEQYRVTREGATEPPFSGSYTDNKSAGLYRCVCCGSRLFESATKFDSGTGWPSFFAPVDERTLSTHADLSHGMRRTEIRCSACDAHLGHLFEDGPAPTGQRYCINSAALDFDPENDSG